MVGLGPRSAIERAEIGNSRPTVVRACALLDHFGTLQAALEAQGVAVQSAESEYVAQHSVTLAEDQATEVLKRVEAPEQDEDVQRVFHNLGETNTPVSL